MPKGAARAAAFVELPARIGARDSVVVARVCLAMRDPKVRIGSYHGLLAWDSTKARLVDVEKGKMGMRIENTTKAGVIDFAGAFPAGFDDRAAFTVKLALRRAGKLPPLKLHMSELNEVSGTVLTPLLRVTGYPSTLTTVPGPLKKESTTVAANARKDVPNQADSSKKKSSGGGGGSSKVPEPPTGVVLMSFAPAEAVPGSETVIRGKGFTPTGNTVRFGDFEIRDLASSDGGTLLRFRIPTRMPATGEVPPMVVGPGDYEVVVRNARGTSNMLRLMVKD